MLRWLELRGLLPRGQLLEQQVIPGLQERREWVAAPKMEANCIVHGVEAADDAEDEGPVSDVLA